KRSSCSVRSRSSRSLMSATTVKCGDLASIHSACAGAANHASSAPAARARNAVRFMRPSPRGPTVGDQVPRIQPLGPESSVDPLLRRDVLVVVGQRVLVHRAVIDPHRAALAAPAVEPGGGVLEPGLVVALGVILVRVGTARFLAVARALDGDRGLADQIVE